MCAIAGIYVVNHIDSSEVVLSNILAKMQSRGPDSCHTYVDNNFYAGMNRLSINDVEKGVQPFCNFDCCVF